MEEMIEREKIRRKKSLRWDRIIMVSIILLILLAGLLYLFIHIHKRTKDKEPEKVNQDKVLPDMRPPCGTTKHPCPNETCKSEEGCLL